VEAARASIDWSFATYDIDRIVHCIDCENVGSQGVARRLGARTEGEIELFGHTADLWVTHRATWQGQSN
jgi:RimJ/RimL family protein N-acetyltransferase